MPKIVNAGGPRTNVTRTVTSPPEAKVITTPELVFKDIVTEDPRIVLETLPSGKKQIALVENVADGATTNDLDARIDVLESYFPEPERLKVTEVRANDATVSLEQPQILYIRSGRCHVDDVGDRPWSNIVFDFGLTADSTSGEAGGINLRYGEELARGGFAEEKWIAAEITLIGDPTGNPKRTPILRFHTGTNPVTLEPVPLLINGQGSLSFVSSQGPIGFQPGVSQAVTEILEGPDGVVRTRWIGNKGAANGAVTVDLMPTTLLNTALVPFQSQAGVRNFVLCELTIIARDLAASTWERYNAKFVWVGGRTTAQGGAVAAIVADLHDVSSALDGTPDTQVGLVGSGKRVTIEEDGGEGGIRVRYTGRLGVNMNEVCARLSIQLPA